MSYDPNPNLTLTLIWTQPANDIACMNHGKAYLLCLQTRIVEFRMASKMERCHWDVQIDVMEGVEEK